MAKRNTRSAAGTRPDPRVRGLYTMPPDEFVAARDALARALAAEGSSDAVRVRHLRRPTVAVWLLNAVARERPDVVSTLFAAGDRLRQAQVRAVGGDAAELRTSSAALRDAVLAGLTAAREVAAVKGRGASLAVLDQVERALRAAATADLSLRTQLQQGVLEQLPEPGGVELLAGLAAVQAVAPDRHATGTRQTGRGPARETHGVQDRDRGAERARKAAERSARVQAAVRERERRQALAGVERAEQTLRAAEERVRKAERELADAQRQVASAQAEVATARQAVEAARARAEAASRGAATTRGAR